MTRQITIEHDGWEARQEVTDFEHFGTVREDPEVRKAGSDRSWQWFNDAPGLTPEDALKILVALDDRYEEMKKEQR